MVYMDGRKTSRIPSRLKTKMNELFKHIMRYKLYVLGFVILVVAAVIAANLAGYFAKDESQPLAVAEVAQPARSDYLLQCVPRGHDNYRSNNTLAIDPNDENVLYIAVELKGVFKSTDGGASWKKSDSGIKGYPMESDPAQACLQEFGRLVINPEDSRHLLLSRVESPGTDTMPFSENAGLWESKNAGDTWRQIIKPGMNMSGSKAIAFAPNDAKTIYYGINNGRPSNIPSAQSYAGYNKVGILYVTHDGGKSWIELPTGATIGLRAMGLSIDKNDPSKLWLFTMTQKEDGNGTADPGLQQGAMLSLDGGKTWRSFAQRLPESTRALIAGAMNPIDSNNVYVTGMTHGGPQASFVTLDSGESWAWANRSMYFVSYDPHDPTGRRMLGYDPFQMPTGLYESLDKGLTWRLYAALPDEVDNSDQFGVRIESIVFAPKTKGVVFMNGSKGHVWKSADSGKTWQTLMTIDSIGGLNKNKAGNIRSSEADG